MEGTSVGHQEEGMVIAAKHNFDQSDRIKELQKFISPDFVGLAFNLPPTCCTFWGLMEEEIDSRASNDLHPFSKDVDEIITFLGRFFSTVLIERIKHNIELLRKSFLGIDYTLRQGKAMIATTMLRDIESECTSEAGSPLHNFLGHVSDAVVEWLQAQEIKSLGDPRGQSSGRGNDGGRTRGRRAARGGRGVGCRAGRGRGNAVMELKFKSMDLHFESIDREKVLVPMSPLSTPPHGDLGRHETLQARSWEFVSHVRVRDDCEKLYDPDYSQSGKVFVFHGTRTSSLPHFQRRGIDSLFGRSDFSQDGAFYVSNSIRQAYEHPLHCHPSKNLNDLISVMVFELDVAVLHGLEPPPGNLSPLTNLWFPDGESEWQKFCMGNLEGTGYRHTYDIVIGPVCMPGDEGDSCDKLQISLPNNTPLTQIAFCSRRARAWLELCFKKVYIETRGVA